MVLFICLRCCESFWENLADRKENSKSINKITGLITKYAMNTFAIIAKKRVTQKEFIDLGISSKVRIKKRAFF